MEEREPSYTVDRNVNWYSQCGKEYGGSQKIKNRTSTIFSSYFTPGIYLKENNNNKKNPLIQKETCTSIDLVAFFISVKIWKQSKYS